MKNTIKYVDPSSLWGTGQVWNKLKTLLKININNGKRLTNKHFDVDFSITSKNVEEQDSLTPQRVASC